MPPYRLAPEAQRDLDMIAEYIAIEAYVERSWPC
jgi:plasmid stabilization system protein ParE